MTMQWLPAALAGWLCMAALLIGRRHAGLLLRLWREPVLRTPVVIVESDDWGPGPATDGDVLRELATTLQEIRDARGRPPVMTLGLVLAIPDGRRIAADGYDAYHRLTLEDTRYTEIARAIRQGLDAGVFCLQRHGLEHLWPASLLACAQTDRAIQAWLVEPDARSEDLPPALQSRWTDASTRPTRPPPPAAVEAAVADETTLLRTLFGVAPRVAVPNTFVWEPETERAWRRHGVEIIVTPGTRYSGRDRDGRLVETGERILNGERSAQGLRQIVRDAYFEPARGHRVADVLRDFAARNAAARPLLLETHRENFIRGDATRQASLQALRDALTAVLAARPDTHFMSTAELADALIDPDSLLRQAATRTKLSAWLRRVLQEPALHRPLKWSGLGLLMYGILAVLPSARITFPGLTAVRSAP